MRVDGEPAFILHQRPYRETSTLVELFTLNHGRIGAVAKGARRQSKKGNDPLVPFQPYIVGWFGRGELVTITQLESNGCAANLQGERLYCALYMNELLMRLLHHHDPHENLFRIYGDALGQLERASDVQSPLRLFERDLLTELGYGLVLDHDIQDNSSIESDVVYDYIIDAGPRRLGAAAATGIPMQGRSLLALVQGKPEPGVQKEIRSLMRAAIDARLDGKPLHSRQMMQRLKKNQQLAGKDSAEVKGQ
ncbi:MAG: DNA repair protein RecO [Proteobacteria bacterium]|nr:DNA repair protein RecO [Pseudomonadota bacterium]